MARPRSYRHDVKCPHCGSNWMRKDGRSRGKQTYRCGECHHRHTPEGNRHYYPERTIRHALDMYAEGASMSAIARAMDIKLSTVFSWVKKSPSGGRGGGNGASEAETAGS